MPKYLIKLESGRDVIINATDDMDAAYIALYEAACIDDYQNYEELIDA